MDFYRDHFCEWIMRREHNEIYIKSRDARETTSSKFNYKEKTERELSAVFRELLSILFASNAIKLSNK